MKKKQSKVSQSKRVLPKKEAGAQKDYSTETHLIYGKFYTEKWDYSHHLVPPITASATFRLESAQRGAQGFIDFAHTVEGEEISKQTPIYIYDRLGEPNKDLLEDNLALAESGDACVTFASGMGAISAALGILTAPGDQVISHKMLYGCTYELLTLWYPRYRIDVKFIDMTDLKNLERAITSATRAVYFETPVNPTLDLIDIEAISRIVKSENSKRRKQNHISVVVDNTFATPFCQRPIELWRGFRGTLTHKKYRGIRDRRRRGSDRPKMESRQAIAVQKRFRRSAEHTECMERSRLWLADACDARASAAGNGK